MLRRSENLAPASNRGNVIAFVGSTGDAEVRTHRTLHFEIHILGPEKHWWHGIPIDPYPILLRVLTRWSVQAGN
jgi:murein DD-endopeptidase MepM/ murein hydrolase activator NlpD